MKTLNEKEILKKWETERQKAFKNVLPEDLNRVLQEIDNIFNGILDYLKFRNSLINL